MEFADIQTHSQTDHVSMLNKLMQAISLIT